MPGCITLKTERSIARLVLKKPPINALDERSLENLMAAIDTIEADKAVKVVIISSGLPMVFCAGGDLKYWPHKYPTQPDIVSAAGRDVFSRLERLTKPTIAAIQGRVIGDGLSLVLACDIRIADRDTTFVLPEVDYGFIPGWGTIERLTQVAGRTATAELLFLGEPIGAQRAHTMGMINTIINSDELTLLSYDLANRIARKPPATIRHAKQALLGALDDHPLYQTDASLRCFSAVWGGDEWRNGINDLFGDAVAFPRKFE